MTKAGRKPGSDWDTFRESKQQLPASVAALDPWMHLASAVVLTAFRDLSNPDEERALDALFWLAGESAALYCEALELPPPLEAICSSQPVQKVSLPPGVRFRDWRETD